MKISPVQHHFDDIAQEYDTFKKRQWFYYQQLKALIASLIPPGKTVLEIGCGTGDVLASLRPAKGVGMDISPKMIELAKKKHPEKQYEFIASDITSFTTKKHFDYIFMSDVIEHLSDVESSLAKISALMDSKTVFINTMANPKWEWILMIAEKLHMKMPEGPHDRISFEKIESILRRHGTRITHHNFSTLIPVYLTGMTPFINTYLEPHLKQYAFIEYFTAQKV